MKYLETGIKPTRVDELVSSYLLIIAVSRGEMLVLDIMYALVFYNNTKTLSSGAEASTSVDTGTLLFVRFDNCVTHNLGVQPVCESVQSIKG